MKTIQLNLLADDPENHQDLTIRVDDKDFKKVLKVIDETNKKMPHIRYLQESEVFAKYGNFENEIDYTLHCLDKAKIKYNVIKVDAQVQVEEGFMDEEECKAEEAKSSGKIR